MKWTKRETGKWGSRRSCKEKIKTKGQQESRFIFSYRGELLKLLREIWFPRKLLRFLIIKLFIGLKLHI